MTLSGNLSPILLPPRPRILVTNDDGILSPGLLALKRTLEQVGETVVVAPDRNRTGVARSITMRAPLWVEEMELADGAIGYATDGTPVDCVRLAALGFLEEPPDLIVSGINLGGNLGDDITYSGTVAAAFEGIMLDIPALAVSAESYRDGYDLEVPARVAAALVRELTGCGFPRKTLLNVNCPDLTWDALAGIRVTTLGKRIYGDKVQLQETAGRRRRYFIYGDELSYHHEVGTDFEAIAEGFVSVTPIHFELTAVDTVGQLRSLEAILSRAAVGIESVGPEPQAAAATSPLPGRNVSRFARRPSAVVFDLDGTLVDSVELIFRSFQHAVRVVLGRDMLRETLVANVGKPLYEQMVSLDANRADELVAAYREYNHREHDRMLRVFPEVNELLLGLRRAGVRVGLVTSKSRDTTEMGFAVTGIGRFLDAVVTADDTSRHKPDPEPILLCLGLLGVSPEEAVCVGDSPYDVQAAKAAAVRSVAVTWGVFGEEILATEAADRMVRSIRELAQVLGIVVPKGGAEMAPA